MSILKQKIQNSHSNYRLVTIQYNAKYLVVGNHFKMLRLQ